MIVLQVRSDSKCVGDRDIVRWQLFGFKPRSNAVEPFEPTLSQSQGSYMKALSEAYITAN